MISEWIVKMNIDTLNWKQADFHLSASQARYIYILYQLFVCYEYNESNDTVDSSEIRL